MTTAYSRRGVLGMGAALGAVAVVGCASKSTSAESTATSTDTTSAVSTTSSASASTSGATSAAATTAAAASNTKLSSGSYTAQFDQQSQQLSGAYIVNGIDATIEGGTWESTTADQAVFLVVNGGSLTLKNATVKKSGAGSNSGSDAYNFYGLNSAIVVVGSGSQATIKNVAVSSTSEGSNLLFATSAGKITASGVTLTSTANSSRGLDATYEGVIVADSVNISTQGNHCAAIATDRGNGTITVTGNTRLRTVANDSPLIYSTGAITVSGATGTAVGAQTMVIEGKNSITLKNCTFTTTGTEGVMLYQSMSGDAADANATSNHSTLTMTNSSLTSATSKPMLYVTNTTSVVNLTNTTLTNQKSTELLSLQEDRWGTAGSNGGHLTMNVAGCTLKGSMTAGSSSEAAIALTKAAKLTGKTSGSITVTKDSTSSWATA